MTESNGIPDHTTPGTETPGTKPPASSFYDNDHRLLRQVWRQARREEEGPALSFEVMWARAEDRVQKPTVRGAFKARYRWAFAVVAMLVLAVVFTLKWGGVKPDQAPQAASGETASIKARSIDVSAPAGDAEAVPPNEIGAWQDPDWEAPTDFLLGEAVGGDWDDLDEKPEPS